MGREFFTINLIVYGEPEMGLYCAVCQCDAVVRLKIVGQTEMTVFDFDTYDSCVNCEGSGEFAARIRKSAVRRLKHSDIPELPEK